MSTPEPLISCLCVTERRVPLLQRAVACFLAQTWPARELVVLHEAADTATQAWLQGHPHPLIRPLAVPSSPRLALGTKRQLSLEAARGDYVATWDDDDWSAPTRLAEQMQVIRDSGRAACVLHQWLVMDQALGQVWLSELRTWEASLVARRDAMPRYQPLDRGEDLISIAEIARAEQLAALRSPHLYVYTYHGRNVGSRIHFKRNIFNKAAQPLPASFARRVQALLADPNGPPITADEVAAAAAG